MPDAVRPPLLPFPLAYISPTPTEASTMSSLVSIVTNLFNATVVAQRPSQDGTCPAEEDRGFGPTIRWCRLGFDFSLLFQQTILSILPSAVFIILAVVRVGLVSRRPAVVASGWLSAVKPVRELVHARHAP